MTGTEISNVRSAIIRNASIGIWKNSFVLDTAMSFLHITEKNLFKLLRNPEPPETTSGRFLLILNYHPFKMGFVLECLYNTP